MLYIYIFSGIETGYQEVQRENTCQTIPMSKTAEHSPSYVYPMLYTLYYIHKFTFILLKYSKVQLLRPLVIKTSYFQSQISHSIEFLSGYEDTLS